MSTVFGTLPDGREVRALSLAGGGLTARLLTLGSVLADLRLEGVGHALTLGSAEPTAYAGPLAYFGAIVGPVANRIAGAEIEAGGKVHRLVANEGANTLHGGRVGLHGRIWEIAEEAGDRAVLVCRLADGDEGWPGNREIRAAWRLLPGAVLELELTATTDAPTHLAPAHHGYWRMGPGDTLAGHRLTIAADRVTEVDAALLPTGRLPEVAGTEFDFRSPAPIGPEAPRSYDHNFCLAEAPRAEPAFVARLEGPSAAMTITSTEPGLQIYDAGRLDTSPFAGHEGRPYGRFAGLAMEPQRWPDAPHHPGFPTTALAPGETYRQLSRWAFEKR